MSCNYVNSVEPCIERLTDLSSSRAPGTSRRYDQRAQEWRDPIKPILAAACLAPLLMAALVHAGPAFAPATIHGLQDDRIDWQLSVPAADAAAPQGPVMPAVEPYATSTPVVASWFGPGLYGNRTACGLILTTELLGVAHRTLPCGSPVTLEYRGATVTVPVIDRGPFVHSREFDLTYATRLRLGCPDLCALEWPQ